MKCPNCGAQNDPMNRFCDQCGSPLASNTSAAASPTQVADQPSAAVTVCPNCHATVLPGEAFCDECGTPLNPTTVGTASNDAPTLFAPVISGIANQPANGQEGPICSACGHRNLPGDQFCDNCGAALTATPAASDSTAAPANAESRQNEGPSMPASDGDVPVHSQVVQANSQPPTPLPQEGQGNGAPANTAAETAPDTATVAPTTVSNADPQAAYEADRKRLEGEIDRQRQIVERFEQMQTMFGAAAPPAVEQGLSQARDALAKAQAELDALQPPAPAVDPAEVARLTEEVNRQQQILSQFEQMQMMFGNAAPPAVEQGLNQARDALAKAQADLDALTGGTARPATSSGTAIVSPPEEKPTEPVGPPTGAAAPDTSTEPNPAAMPSGAEAEPPAPATVAAAPASVPRLVVQDGREIPLPSDKSEIVIGREDPISGIFPEIDLTGFGGESGGVSRQHARLSRNNAGWTITDLNSTNYTRVDGSKIDPNVPIPIQDGTQIQLGRVAMTFRA